MSFQVGDRVEVVFHPRIEHKELVGRTFIVDAANVQPPDGSFSVWGPGCMCGEWWLANVILRKLPPPQELGSWDEVERLTKWNPQGVEA